MGKAVAAAAAVPVAILMVVAMLFGGVIGPEEEAAACPDSGGDSAEVVSGSTNVDTAMKTLMAAGLKAHQAAGLVGNFLVESGPKLDPTARNAGGYTGIAQWDPTQRWPLAQRYAKAKGLNPLTLVPQLRFALWELGVRDDWTGEGGYAAVGSKLKASSDSDAAAEIIFAGYEKPGDDSLPKRQGYARDLTTKYGKPQAPVAVRAIAAPVQAGPAAGGDLKAKLRVAAAWARANGWEVSEFQQEGTNDPDAHMPGSDHNSGLAFDANWPGESGDNTPGEVKNWPKFRAYLKSAGLGAIYGNDAAHMNHVHVMPPGRPKDAVGSDASPNDPVSDTGSGGSDCPVPVSAEGSTEWAEFGKSSENIACASGTRDVGVHDGYFEGKKVRIRLCAVQGLPSTAEESGTGQYAVKGAGGEAVINSRMSSDYARLVAKSKKDRVKLAVFSSFRSMAKQSALWNERGCAAKRPACLLPDGSLNTAKPGMSFHQTGLALDFQASDRGSKVFTWLSKNAHAHGIGNFPKESWHWDPSWWGDRKGGF